MIEADPVQQSLHWGPWAWFFAIIGILVFTAVSWVGNLASLESSLSTMSRVLMIVLVNIPYLWLSAAMMRHMPERWQCWVLFAVLLAVNVALVVWVELPWPPVAIMALSALGALIYDASARQMAAIPMSWAMLVLATLVIAAFLVWLPKRR